MVFDKFINYHNIDKYFIIISYSSMLKTTIFIIIILSVLSSHSNDITQQLQDLVNKRNLKGLSLQITQNTKVVYHIDIGYKNDTGLINNSTMFRVASLSKSLSSFAIMQLVQQQKLRLNQSISQLLGFHIVNPNFPNLTITLQMVLSHQSSIVQCQPYYTNFITAAYSAKDGHSVPNISQILLPEGKFYNKCMFSSTHKPGQYYQYVNLNFGIAGTIVQKISQIRFDEYQRNKILKYLSVDTAEIATFNAATIKNVDNLGIIYNGNNGLWVKNYDYYPDRKIVQRNLTGYQLGKNGVIFSPQGGLRASSRHLTNYIYTLKNKGVTKEGIRLLKQDSVKQMLRPRYQFRGTIGGSANDFHTYGLGLYETTYRANDIIIPHQVVKGHLGSAYGLISGYHFWQNYTFSYIINGALNGYQYGTGTIYQGQRLAIHSAVNSFINSNKNINNDNLQKQYLKQY